MVIAHESIQLAHVVFEQKRFRKKSIHKPHRPYHKPICLHGNNKPILQKKKQCETSIKFLKKHEEGKRGLSPNA
jgi:hypothetical protein